jgi:acyl-CoA thioester hydrolase
MSMPSNKIYFSDINFYSYWTVESLRYCDTDRQQHINNSVFVMCFESGRVSILYDPKRTLVSDGYSFVIVHISIDFLSEMNWPNIVKIGTRIVHLGQSSITFAQGLFVNDKCVATARSVIVLINDKTRRSYPLPIEILEHLKTYVTEDFETFTT